jgi:hypothetical protein
MPFIGDICYNCLYKVDATKKIMNFNNSFQHRTVDFNDIVTELNPINHSIDLISKNKVLLLYEKIYGKVKQTTMQIYFTDKTLLSENSAKNVGSYVTHHVFGDYLAIAFRKTKYEYIVQLYEIKNMRVVKSVPLDYEMRQILITEDAVYIIAVKRPFINKYDLELNFKGAFGQRENKNAPFYLAFPSDRENLQYHRSSDVDTDELITIQPEKMFVKNGEEVRLVNLKTGDVHEGNVTHHVKFSGLQNLNNVTVFVDYNKEKYLVYSGFNKLSYFSSRGELMAENKIRKSSELTYELFQFSKSGHFGFVCAKKNIILII